MVLTISAIWLDFIYYFMNCRRVGRHWTHPVSVLMISLGLNLLLFDSYTREPNRTLTVVILTQLSDALQYLVGRSLGKYRICYLSPLKTVEGYLYPFLGFLVLGGPILGIRIVLQDYLGGVMGGLISSGYKRWVVIKDYSDLLGEQGGWLDRMDSTYFAILMMRILG